MKEWKNAKGQGKFFSINICDKTGRIKCVFFGSTPDKFYNEIEVNKVYTISNGFVKKTDKNFASINDKEIIITTETEINIENDENDIPEIVYQFKKIKDLDKIQENELIDVVAVVQNIEELTTIYAKTEKFYRKRNILIVDDSNYEISLTLWNEQADNFDTSNKERVIVLKDRKIKEFNGIKNLTLSPNSTLTIDADITEVKKLKNWYKKVSKNKEFQKLMSSNEDDGEKPSTSYSK